MMLWNRKVLASVLTAAMMIGAFGVHGWPRRDAESARPARVPPPRFGLDQGPRGAEPDVLQARLDQPIASRGRLGLFGSPLRRGRYVGRMVAVLAIGPPRIAVEVETEVDGRPIRRPGLRLLDVVPRASVTVGTGRRAGPARIDLQAFDRRFNGSSARSARLRDLRYWTSVDGGRMRAFGEHGPPLSPALTTGAEGGAVAALQRRLAELHYDVGPVDATFGYSTFHAVVAFQKVSGLTRDGRVDADVWAALYDPVVPAPRRHGSGPRIEIDLTRQVLHYVLGGRIVRILDASSGGGLQRYADGSYREASTPTGDFEISQRIDGWYESSVGPMYGVGAPPTRPVTAAYE